MGIGSQWTAGLQALDGLAEYLLRPRLLATCGDPTQEQLTASLGDTIMISEEPNMSLSLVMKTQLNLSLSEGQDGFHRKT